eukprot:6060467-Alexandrium_andersonii.AAC.1
MDAEAEALALALRLVPRVNATGRRVVVAGDCRPVLAYAAGAGRLRRAEQHFRLGGPLADVATHGWQ